MSGSPRQLVIIDGKLRVLTTRPFTWCQTPKILARNVFLVVQFGILCGDFFFRARDWFCSCMKIVVVVDHARNSAQMRFSSAHAKFPNRGSTNAFFFDVHKWTLTCKANFRGVNAQLRAQSCPSNWNTGEQKSNSHFFFLKAASFKATFHFHIFWYLVYYTFFCFWKFHVMRQVKSGLGIKTLMSPHKTFNVTCDCTERSCCIGDIKTHYTIEREHGWM